ncbi:MAG TPA: hypothetical protein VK686_00485 [Bryobacteraceae bacterium]|nr:hypothetical protein [Bryobacteraceae bacterium]
MRLLAGLLFAAACLAQSTLTIPKVRTTINVEQQPIEITLWGTISGSSLALTIDLGDLQAHLTEVLSAQLNKSDRCGDHLTVEQAAIAPAAPSGMLTANVNFERFACVKAFGKQIVKRLVGGHAVIEVNLTPAVQENNISIAADVRKMDADGSLGDVLRSSSLGDSIRDEISDSIESAIQKSADLKSTLPGSTEKAVTLQRIQFADGGAGRLWLIVGGNVRLSAEQLRHSVGQ